MTTISHRGELRIKLDYLRFIAMLLMTLFFGLSYLSKIDLYGILGILILGMLIFSEDVTHDFYVYIMILPFSDFVSINGRNILFIFLLVSSLKILLSKNHKKISMFSIYGFISFLLIEFVNDFFNISIGRFLYIISIIIFFFIFILFANYSKVSRKYASLIIFSTISLVLLFIYIGSSGNMLSTVVGSIPNRFGEETRELGGAMGVPIYIMLFITFTFVFIQNENSNKFTKIVLVMLSMIYAILGFFTLSRVYILGLFVFIFIVLLNYFLQIGKKRTKIFSLFLLFIFFVIMSIFSNEIYILLKSTIDRGAEDVSTGRYDIYMSIYYFLTNNPLNLLFGKGAVYYVIYGYENNLRFGMSAHSLYLDSLMSWGIVGSIIFVFLTTRIFNRLNKEYFLKNTIVSLTPLTVWATMVLVGDAFYYFKTYISIMVVIIIGGLYGENISAKRIQTRHKGGFDL